MVMKVMGVMTAAALMLAPDWIVGHKLRFAKLATGRALGRFATKVASA